MPLFNDSVTTSAINTGSSRSSSPRRVDSVTPRGMVLAVTMLSLLSSRQFVATAFQPVTKTPTRQRTNGGDRYSSFLQYRRHPITVDDDAMMDQPILMQLANGKLAVAEGTIVSSSASSFLQMMAARDNDLSEMDAYLEYVNRRYARMHPPSHVVVGAATTTTASATRNSTATTRRTTNNMKKGEDPLNALGLSRLASAQLHHRLRKRFEQDESTTMTLIAGYVSRFLKPFSYLCGAILIVFALIRSNGYYT
jgi:hypothetical protein